MFKSIVKMLMPSAKTLAKYAADGIAKAVNKSDKEELIAKYALMANEATEVQAYIVKLLVDGKIDNTERDEIAEKLAPFMEKALELL